MNSFLGEFSQKRTGASFCVVLPDPRDTDRRTRKDDGLA